MPTFGAWEYEVLEHTFDVTDFLSMHMYYENPHNEVQEFLANIELMDRFTKELSRLRHAAFGHRFQAVF